MVERMLLLVLSYTCRRVFILLTDLRAASQSVRMREVVLLSLLSAGSSLAAITDRNVFYIKPSRGSSLPSALVHNNYPADGNQVLALLCKLL